ncbi:Hypothetical protein GLP15_425 [Giardia lamblia P15]|uniref:Uncharacterized protein n=1 Tax=Giardia intestinalis (strain P15) TaxID=658858 RepID=E1F062_GIAIA|nr:Hypothetical protein GLP15_425 [Giardia lamblia P15]
MTTYTHADRAAHSSCSSRKTESKKKSGIAPLSGFLPTSAESIRLALSLSLHGMPHDRVFGVYKEGYYTLINTYLWDLSRFNYLIDAFSEYLIVTPISLENFSTGLVSFIKISDAFCTLLDFIILSDNRELRDSICTLYKEKCAQQDSNLYPYELRVREISQQYIACIDSELHEGLTKQKNRYRTAYTRLLEMYSEDIAAVNRILGNVGAQFISDRNILGSAGLFPTILTSRLLSFIKTSFPHNTDFTSSPITMPPVLDFRSFDGGFPDLSSRSPIPRKYQSPVMRVKSMQQDREYSTRSSTSYIARKNYADNKNQSLYQNSIRQKSNLFSIRAFPMNIMSSTETQVHIDQQQQQKRAIQRSSAAGFFVREGVGFETQHIDENSSIAGIQGIDVELQTETDINLATIDESIWTVATDTNNRFVTTDTQLQITTQTQVELEMQRETAIQTEADTTVVCSLSDLHTALQNKVGFDDSITLAYTLLEYLLEQVHNTEEQSISNNDVETGAEDAAVQTVADGQGTLHAEECDNNMIVTNVDLHTQETSVTKSSHLNIERLTTAIHQEKPSENQRIVPDPNREETLLENDRLWKQIFDPYLAQISFAQCLSQDISDGENSLQPIFDTCDQSSLIMSTDGVVGAAIFSVSRSFPEFIYDTLTSNSSEFHASQPQLQTMAQMEEGHPRHCEAENVSAELSINMRLKHVPQENEEHSYETLYNNLLSKYTSMEEQSLKRTLEAEELQAKVDMLTEEIESLRVELQRVKDGYAADCLNNYGMIVQGSISENKDLSGDRYLVNSKLGKKTVIKTMKQQEEQCQSLKQTTEDASLFLSADLLESKQPIDHEVYSNTTEKIVCSVIKNDAIVDIQDEDALAESAITIQPQDKAEHEALERERHLLTMQENTFLLRQLDALERQEQTLLAKLNQVSEESQAKAKLNKNMQSMLSTISLTVSTQLSDMEQLNTLVDSIETNTFSLRPEIKKLHSYLATTSSVSSHRSSSASFIDCLDD